MVAFLHTVTGIGDLIEAALGTVEGDQFLPKLEGLPIYGNGSSGNLGNFQGNLLEIVHIRFGSGDPKGLIVRL